MTAASNIKHTLAKMELPALLLVPVVLAICAATGIEQSALLTLIASIAAIIIFFAGFEASKPSLRTIMPTVVLAALAAAGRILFAALPDVKPVSAICIMAGAIFGKRCGFMVGALAALCSNFFFGQGPWTPWQMYAWGLMGYLAGVLASKGAFSWQPVIKGKPRTSPWLFAFAILAVYGYGFILNSWYVIGYVRPLTLATALAAYAAGFALDSVHVAATVVFLLLIYAPWRRKLERIKAKYELE